MKFVVNEWLPEYFLPNATPEEKALLEKFLTRFLNKNDQILVRQPSPFLNKIYRYPNQYQNYGSTVRGLRNFIKFILNDSDRCEIIDQTVLELPIQTLEKLSKGNFSSDQYLFEAAFFSGTKQIVTTDEKLKNQMKGDTNFSLVLLEDFLATY
jgi:hypothetical protein